MWSTTFFFRTENKETIWWWYFHCCCSFVFILSDGTHKYFRFFCIVLCRIFVFLVISCRSGSVFFFFNENYISLKILNKYNNYNTESRIFKFPIDLNRWFIKTIERLSLSIENWWRSIFSWYDLIFFANNWQIVKVNLFIHCIVKYF